MANCKVILWKCYGACPVMVNPWVSVVGHGGRMVSKRDCDLINYGSSRVLHSITYVLSQLAVYGVEKD